jgi:hypothetical protein
MTTYCYLGRYWCELLLTGSLAFLVSVVVAALWH